MSDTHFAPRRGVAVQAVLLAMATGLAQILTAGMYIVAARFVLPHDFGLIVSALSVGMAMVGFADFGTNALWVRELARGALTTAKLGPKVFTKLAVALVGCLVWLAVALSVSPTSYYWIAGPVAIAMLINQTAQVPLRGAGRGDLVAFTVLADRLVGAIVMTVLVASGVSSSFSLWVALAGGSLGAAALGWTLTPELARPTFRRPKWTNAWVGSGFYGVYGLATSAQSLDLAVMSTFGGPAVAGIYGAVNRWTQPMGLLVGAFSSASAPYVARSASWRDAWTHIRAAAWLPVAAILSCLAVVFLAPFIVEVLIGPEYAGSAGVLQILALATIPGIVNQPLAVFLQSIRRDRVVAMIMVVNVVLVLILVGVFSALFGAVGAALAALLTQSLVAVALLASALVARWESGRTEVPALDRDTDDSHAGSARPEERASPSRWRGKDMQSEQESAELHGE